MFCKFPVNNRVLLPVCGLQQAVINRFFHTGKNRVASVNKHFPFFQLIMKIERKLQGAKRLFQCFGSEGSLHA